MNGNHYQCFDVDPQQAFSSSDVDVFTRGYVAAMMFAESVATSEGAPDESFLDARYTWENVTPEAQERIKNLCASFFANHEADIIEYGAEDAGMDLYYTSAGHGVGYWEEDHGTPEICARLDVAAGRIGTPSLYVGDDGLIYFA